MSNTRAQLDRQLERGYKELGAMLAQIESMRDPPAPEVCEWINQNVYIEEPQGDSTGIIPFHIWPAQTDALVKIKAHKQVIVLKARQLGLSWLVIAFAVWLCIFHRNKAVLVFSKDQDSANEIIRRAGVIVKHLKSAPVSITVSNTTQLAFENGSRIKSFPATEDAGSSFTASLVILDEFAKMRYADQLYTAVKPTIADGGTMVLISTAKGEGNTFHKLWDAARKGESKLLPIFIPWSARPGRTAEWYAQAESDAVSPAHHKQEYPATEEEAFTPIVEERFLPSMILWDALREELPPLGKQEPLVLAADAAVTSDSFALVGVGRHPRRKNDVAVRFVQEWKPPKGGQIDFLGTEDHPGPERVIRRIAKEQNALVLVYDPFQLADMAQRLTRENVIWCEAFSQAGDRLEADKQLLDLIVGKRLAHDGNADLRQHIDNANRKPDVETHRLRIVKRAAPLKIDLAVALSMAAAKCLKLNLG